MELRRKEQSLQAFTDTVEETIRQRFYSNAAVAGQFQTIKADILSGKVSPYAAARMLIEVYMR